MGDANKHWWNVRPYLTNTYLKGPIHDGLTLEYNKNKIKQAAARERTSVPTVSQDTVSIKFLSQKLE